MEYQYGREARQRHPRNRRRIRFGETSRKYPVTETKSPRDAAHQETIMCKKVITIDGRINLADVVRAAGMHRLSIIDALMARGLIREDAVGIADFAIAWICEIRGVSAM